MLPSIPFISICTQNSEQTSKVGSAPRISVNDINCALIIARLFSAIDQLGVFFIGIKKKSIFATCE